MVSLFDFLCSEESLEAILRTQINSWTAEGSWKTKTSLRTRLWTWGLSRWLSRQDLGSESLSGRFSCSQLLAGQLQGGSRAGTASTRALRCQVQPVPEHLAALGHSSGWASARNRATHSVP
jgi:hypothetical protein